MKMHITLDNLHSKIEETLQNSSLKDAEKIITFIDTLNFLQIENVKDNVKKIYLLAVQELIKKQDAYKCIAYLQKILDIDPFDTSIQNMFKLCHLHVAASNDDKENIKILKNVLVVQPYDHELQFILGSMYAKINKTKKAIEHLKLALGISKDIDFTVKILHSLGDLYYANNNNYICKHYLLQAYKLNPNHPDINNFLGLLYNNTGYVDKAIEHFQKSIDFCESSYDISVLQQSAIIYMNLGTAYTHKIDYEKAITYFDKALEHNPKLFAALQNKLFNLHYILHTIHDPMYLFELHKTVNKFFHNVVTNYKESLPSYIPKNLDAGKKLKIGFISSEFIYNGICGVVSYFLISILQHINYNKFDVTCYSLKPVTHAQDLYPKPEWKFVRGISTLELKCMIQADGIDILFDLATHTAEDRLDVFALKAAPIQISYCGYPNTSGLASMDYHIVDRYCDSDGITPGPGGIIRSSTQKYYTEKLIFMDNCFLNYTPYIETMPELNEQPILKNGFLTLGCFNKFNKINREVVAVWEQILEQCESVRLIVKCKEFNTASMKSQFLSMWQNKHLYQRITLLDYCNTNIGHLLEYNKIDIALDTFPYSGTCTTCDALLMGTPVVTLFDGEKQYHVQNVSSSILINARLPEFVCFSKDEIVNKIQYYSSNIHKLQGIKTKVRQNFLDNICNHKKFVNDFEHKMTQVYKEHQW